MTPGITSVARLAWCEIRAGAGSWPGRYLVSRWYVMLLPFTSLTRMMDILDWATISQDLMCVYPSISLSHLTYWQSSPTLKILHYFPIITLLRII